VEEVHSLQNLGTEQLKVLEVQQGDILDENDIERIEDIYGRV
jgi:mannose-6-phosphate isomerase-like protein (cupin superfamily)